MVTFIETVILHKDPDRHANAERVAAQTRQRLHGTTPDGARVSIDATGAVELVTGGSSVGQGIATAMAQICADTLGVDYRRV